MKIENEEILQHIGKTKTQKLQDEITKEYFERYDKKFPLINEVDIFHKSLALITITKPNETEIKNIGMSCLNDLLLDNWGNCLNSLLSGASANLTNISGVANSGTFWGGSNFFTQALTSAPTSPVGTECKVGAGLSTPQRTDFNIETPFGSSPENSFRNTGNGGWNSGLGQVTISTLISPTGGSGSIGEAGLFAEWYIKPAFDDETIMLSHDKISPTVSFIIGEAINVEYILALS